jgi:hypothetical protein
MNIEETLELLEIDSPRELEYFEHFAELIECEEDISFDAFQIIFNHTDTNILTGLIDCYFEDVLKGIPDEAADFYILVSTIWQCLKGLATKDPGKDRYAFAEELFRFRNWYTFDSEVHCKKDKDGCAYELPILEALTLNRLEQLGEDSYSYDFARCMDYPMDEYAMYIHCEQNELKNYPYDYFEEEDEFDDGFIHRTLPVIDEDIPSEE